MYPTSEENVSRLKHYYGFYNLFEITISIYLLELYNFAFETLFRTNFIFVTKFF